MPYLSSNIPSSIFHGSLYSELLTIARCTLLFPAFTPRTSKLYNKMVLQGSNTKQLQNHAKKMFEKYAVVLLKYNITFTELWKSILIN